MKIKINFNKYIRIINYKSSKNFITCQRYCFKKLSENILINNTKIFWIKRFLASDMSLWATMSNRVEELNFLIKKFNKLTIHRN